MPDEALRRVERAGAAGDEPAAARRLVERHRAGFVDEARLRVAAHLGHAPARLALAALELAPGGEDGSGWYEAFELRLGSRASTAIGLALARLLAPFAEPSDVIDVAEAAWREPSAERAALARRASDAAEAASRTRPRPVWSDARGTLAAAARHAAEWSAWAASTLRPDASWQGVSGLPRGPAEAVEQALRAHLTVCLLPWAKGERQEVVSPDGESLRAGMLAAVEAEIASGARDPVQQEQRAAAARQAARVHRLRRVLDAAPGPCGERAWRAALCSGWSDLFGVGIDEERRALVATFVEGAGDALLDLHTPEADEPNPMPAPSWRCEVLLDGASLSALPQALASLTIVATQDVAEWRCGGWDRPLCTVIGAGAVGPHFEVTSPWALIETAANARFADLLLDAAEAAFAHEPRVLARIAALSRHRQVEPSSLEADD